MEVVRESLSDVEQEEEQQGASGVGQPRTEAAARNRDYRAIEAAGSLASGGRSSVEKQNNKALGTGQVKKVYKSTGASDSGDSAALFVFKQ